MAVCSERATKTGAQVCSSDQACLSCPTAARGLFYKATCPAMTDENTSQNGISDLSPVSQNDKRLVNCNKVTGKFEPFVKCLFHTDFFLSLSVVTV